ncbi:venom serine carboxypeptidase-like [Cylas formicarius]|uniref:venom serine carboxypeptidase-like n=1 Tax=Cylas formicarius TaxID=197179 RepID=UPI002958DDF8|nr:venom serine carboxypeptidase-like [Cylas formicarius]
MVKYVIIIFITLQLVQPFYAYRYKLHKPPKRYPIPQDADDPLILTPFLEQNQILEAQQAAVVNYAGFKNITSYSGFFTVDKRFNSNHFFWFFPSENDYKNDPVVLWLQGGPGASSLFALFNENGPFIIGEDLNVTIRDVYWSQSHSVLYIDNPVGTGFSFNDEGGYAQNETKVGSDLYSSVTQFFTLFPELQANEFYISGESYAGKYVPALAYTIHKNNPTADLKINLNGLLIGNGWTDPYNQLDYGEFLYQVGLYDESQKEVLDGYKVLAQKYIDEGDYLRATNYTDFAILGDIATVTGIPNVYNFADVDSAPLDGPYEEFVQTVARSSIHVGDIGFGDDEVYDNLEADSSQNVAPWLAELLSYYRVLIFVGQLDTVCPYPGVVNYLKQLNFSAAAEYKSASREVWFVDNDVAGYYKRAGNLTELLVRSAGHMVPTDQPEWAFNFLYRFTRGLSLNDDSKPVKVL